ncbi:MAG: MetQ/NlpA family ABC transporter substrate-binding protein [Defluviitaleaceae bacterium]|nr:MetQ/NlpA family ABC transporter substrate-binding protein [Defluviitaleaceae bacterium]
MKKIITFLLGLTALVALAACGGNGDNGDYIVFTIGASSVPHAQILAQAAPLMLEEGFVLEIVEFDDFVLPNIALRDGAVDANFFQHRPFLANFNANHGTDLVPVFGVHFEPLRLYAGRLYSLDDITSGATIAIPDDPSNEARALQLLDDLELNRNDLNITPLAAELLPRILPDVDFAVINGNFALQGGVFYRNIYGAAEADESEAAENFTNFVVVRAGYEDNKALQALIRAISSDVVRQFIHDEYLGRIVPQF